MRLFRWFSFASNRDCYLGDQAERLLNGEVAEWSKAAALLGSYTGQTVSEVRILPLSATTPAAMALWHA
jgi:hypothetical protein